MDTRPDNPPQDQTGKPVVENLRSRGLVWGVVAYGSAVLAAVLVTTVIILALGHDPLMAFKVAFKDSLATVGGLGQTLNRMTPMLLASLAFSLGLQARLFNIGLDGQIYAGAIVATGMGFLLADTGLGGWLGIPLLLIAGLVGGMLWVAVPGLMRVTWGVNEIFSTVMLNFVTLYLVEYLATGPWNDPLAGEAITYPIPRSLVLPLLLSRGGAHTGVLLACIAAVLLWWFLFRTITGYEIRAAGANPRAAQFGGVSLTRIGLLALMVSGGVAGLAGAVEVSGVHERLLLGLTPDYGIMAILIAVTGRYHPLALMPVSFGFAVLVAGSDSLQRTVGFPAAAVLMVQALVVLVVLGVDALRTRRERYTV